MSPSLQVHPRLVTLLRRVAHVLSVLILFFFAVMIGGEVMSGCKRAETPRAATPASSPAASDAVKLPDIAGTYTLVSINGTPLPFTVTHEGPGIQVTSGTFTIRPDGTCATMTAFVMPSGQAQSREVSATYTRDGSRLTMQWQGAGVTNGNVEGDTFTMDNEGQLFLYRKAH